MTEHPAKYRAPVLDAITDILETRQINNGLIIDPFDPRDRQARSVGMEMNTGMQTKVRLATVLAGPPIFAHAMRAARIHVGMGRNPVCVTCGVTWPCSTELAATRD